MTPLLQFMQSTTVPQLLPTTSTFMVKANQVINIDGAKTFYSFRQNATLG